MYVKGVSFVGCPTENLVPRRSYSHLSNKKIHYDFQKFRCPQLKYEEIQLQESLRVLDRYFETKRNKYTALIQESHNTLLKERCAKLAEDLQHTKIY
jgi:hypothetical protein